MCESQWRTGGLGFRTGLDNTACISTLRLYLPKWQRLDDGAGAPGAFDDLSVADLMEDVQVIERAILEADNERREREKPPERT